MTKVISGNPWNNFCMLYIVSFVAPYSCCSPCCSSVDIEALDFPLFSQWKNTPFKSFCKKKKVHNNLIPLKDLAILTCANLKKRSFLSKDGKLVRCKETKKSSKKILVSGSKNAGTHKYSQNLPQNVYVRNCCIQTF